MIELLHSAGADVNQTDTRRQTALMYVAVYIRRQRYVNPLISQ